MNKRAIHFLPLLFICQWIFAQNPSTDSLTAVLSKLPDGKEKIEVLNQLLKAYLNTDLDKARNYGYQVVDLSKKTGNNLALATAYKDIGTTHLIASNFDSSQYYNRLALREYDKLRKENGGNEQVKIMEGYAGTICNIGNWHYYQSALDSATIYLLRAVELSKQSGLEKVKATALGTLAFIYLDQSKYDQAIAMQFEALHAFEKLGNQEGISRSYQGIGEINCDYLKKCELALEYYRKSLAIKKSLGSERSMAYSFIKIGSAYEKLSKLDSANFYYEKTIELAKKLDDKRLLVDGYSALAEIAEEMGKSEQERIRINQQFIEIANEIGRLDGVYIGYWNLGNIYEEHGDFERAISYYEKAKVLAQEQKDYRLLEKINYGLYSNYKDHGHDPSKALAALEAYLVNHDSVTNADKFRASKTSAPNTKPREKEATIAEQTRKPSSRGASAFGSSRASWHLPWRAVRCCSV
ncbi:MAG: tetratricopeptide repeat protein [Saprospiraceae bacterium]|nr:tetratricopeptide repeat protein [Saprospiraceae bacterium]